MAAALACAAVGAPAADLDPAPFGLYWGQSAEDVTDAADAKVFSWSTHQRFGQSFEVDRLPEAMGGEINRIVYFNSENQLLRIWVNFGYPGGSVWEQNYLLDDALAKYQGLKTRFAGRGTPGECTEPELTRIEEEGRVVLDRIFRPNRTVWACEFGDETTALKLSLRRLGDTPAQRFDVIVDAQDSRAVAHYRAKHPIRGFGHGELDPAQKDVELSCEDAAAAGADAPPYVLLIQRRCEFEARSPD